MQQEHSESAPERRIVLHKSDRHLASWSTEHLAVVQGVLKGWSLELSGISEHLMLARKFAACVQGFGGLVLVHILSLIHI